MSAFPSSQKSVASWQAWEMPPNCQDKIRSLAARHRESLAFPLSTSSEQELHNLQEKTSHVRGPIQTEEKVLCLCHRCSERTYGCIEDSAKLREPYWMTRRTVLRHLTAQKAHADSILAALGHVLMAAGEPNGIRYLNLNYYLVLVETHLRLRNHHRLQSGDPAVALERSPWTVEEDMSGDVADRCLGAHQPSSSGVNWASFGQQRNLQHLADPLQEMQHTTSPCSSIAHPLSSELNSASFENKELPEYRFIAGGLIGQWNLWPTLLAEMSGRLSLSHHQYWLSKRQFSGLIDSA